MRCSTCPQQEGREGGRQGGWEAGREGGGGTRGEVQYLPLPTAARSGHMRIALAPALGGREGRLGTCTRGGSNIKRCPSIM